MAKHDPRKLLEEIRNHLAAHDRRVLFLLGAGTSSSVDIGPPQAKGDRRKPVPLVPGTESLTALCAAAVERIGGKHAKAWRAFRHQCDQEHTSANIEHILSRVRMKIDAVADGERLAGLDRAELRRVEAMICSTIAKTVLPADDTIPLHTPHDDFALWIRKVTRTVPLEIFTTNYDVLLERAFEAARIPVFDGFAGAHRPFFYPESLEDDRLLPKPPWVRLWKLHGSVTWSVLNTGNKDRIMRGEPSERGEMILPSHRKYDESRKQPYIAFMDRLSRLASAEHALLISVGYSFRDDHINAVLYGALENRNTANVVALMHSSLSQSDEIVSAAKRRSNLTVIGPNGGVISGDWGEWQLTHAVDDRTSGFIDDAFDSNAVAGDEAAATGNSADLGGQMRLGDFNRFGRFLNAMGLSGE